MLFSIEHALQDGSTTRTGDRRVLSKRVLYVELGADGEPRHPHYAPYLDYRPLADGEPAVDAILERPECAWLDRDLEHKAQGYAVAHVVPEHLAEVRDARLALIGCPSCDANSASRPVTLYRYAGRSATGWSSTGTACEPGRFGAGPEARRAAVARRWAESGTTCRPTTGPRKPVEAYLDASGLEDLTALLDQEPRASIPFGFAVSMAGFDLSTEAS